MRREDVDAAMALLLIGTGGESSWNDANVELYVQELSTLSDPHALQDACRVICRTWANPGKPPLAVVLDAYKSEETRRRMERAALPPSEDKIVDPKIGREIARSAYHAWCYQNHREPNDAILDGYAAEVGN